MPFGGMDSGRPKEKYVGWGLHWCHTANTIEPSMCGGDAAFFQITLTTYYYYYYLFLRAHFSQENPAEGDFYRPNTTLNAHQIANG